MTKTEQFAKLNGIEWHEHKYDQNRDLCSCGLWETLTELDKHFTESNPTFVDAKNILEMMQKRDDRLKFVDEYLFKNVFGILVPVEYILNPDKLLDAAILFCEENKE